MWSTLRSIVLGTFIVGNMFLLSVTTIASHARPRDEVREKLKSDKLRRVLSLDGGGIRGAFTASVLVRFEEELRTLYKCPDLLLSDFFDVVGGTSTGSLLAAGIAKGIDAKSLRDVYLKNGTKIFDRTWVSKVPLVNQLYTRYSATSLETTLKEMLGENTTFSSELSCSLIVVAERISNADMPDPFLTPTFFNNINTSVTYNMSKDVPLWKALRASSAAPTFFPPFSIELDYDGERVKADFIDGGITGFNNPESVLLKILTDPYFKIGYPKGSGRLLLVSVGTGRGLEPVKAGEAEHYNGLDWARFLVNRLLGGSEVYHSIIANRECYTVLDFDNPILAAPSVTKKDDENDNPFGIFQPLISTPYVDLSSREQREQEGKVATRFRFNARLDKTSLDKLLGKGAVKDGELKGLLKMDDIKAADRLAQIGDAVAAEFMDEMLRHGSISSCVPGVPQSLDGKTAWRTPGVNMLKGFVEID